MTTASEPKPLARNYFCFNGHDNGGESFGLETKILEKQDGRVVQQEFTLNSYCNGTRITLNNEMITAAQLRELANQLDRHLALLCSQKLTSGRQDKKLSEHKFIFEPVSSCGWPSDSHNLSLTTEYFDNGDGPPGGIYTNQNLTLRSWGTEATIHLCGASICSENLRKLANQLDVMMATLPQPEGSAK